MQLLKTYSISLQQILPNNIEEYYEQPAEKSLNTLTEVSKYLVYSENKKYLGTFSKNTQDEYKKYVYRRYNVLELRDTKKSESLLDEITDEIFFTYYLNKSFDEIPQASLTKFKRSFNNIFYSDILNFTRNSKILYVDSSFTTRPIDSTNFTIDYIEGKIVSNLEESVEIYGLLDIATLQIEPKLELEDISAGFVKDVYITRDNYVKIDKRGSGYLVEVMKDFIFYTNNSKLVNGLPCNNTYLYLNKGLHYIEESEIELDSDIHHNSTDIFNSLLSELKINDLKLAYTNTLSNCSIHILDYNNYIEATYEFN